MFLRISILAQDRFIDVFRRVVEEYVAAYEHGDSGKIAVQTPSPAFISNASFNFISKGLSVIPPWPTVARSGHRLHAMEFALLEADGSDAGVEEPMLFVSEGQDTLTGTLAYRADRATLRTVRRFVRNLQLFALALAQKPHSGLPGIAESAPAPSGWRLGSGSKWSR
jgi:hypothetical protein